MTTAEIGLVTTAIVGVAAAASPALTSWLDRRHKRELERARRLHEQRRLTYIDLGIFLERQRTILQRTGYQSEFTEAIPPPPEQLSDEAWAELQARAAITGSVEVQAKMTAYREAIGDFSIAALEFKREDEKRNPREALPDRWLEAQEIVVAMRVKALEAIDEAERAMRDELAGL